MLCCCLERSEMGQNSVARSVQGSDEDVRGTQSWRQRQLVLRLKYLLSSELCIAQK